MAGTWEKMEACCFALGIGPRRQRLGSIDAFSCIGLMIATAEDTGDCAMMMII
jgi:hypothetical protein